MNHQQGSIHTGRVLWIRSTQSMDRVAFKSSHPPHPTLSRSERSEIQSNRSDVFSPVVAFFREWLEFLDPEHFQDF
jgi:hypothetical protein